MATTPRLQIAIIGAGIAGLTAAVGLKDHPGFDVNLYDRATELREIGASIALGPNGLRTLERLGVHEALDDEVAFRNPSGFPMIYRHWQTNEITSVDEHHGHVEWRHRTARFYRVHLQEALLRQVSRSQLHLRKTFDLARYNASTDDVTVTFTDGTSITADIILAADGIRSAVRRFFVPSSDPKWTGGVAFRSVFDAKLVEDLNLDPTILDEANHWWGPDKTFFASRLGKNLFTTVGSFFVDPTAPDARHRNASWNSDADVEVLRKHYKDWHPVIQQLLSVTPHTREYPNSAAPGLDTWLYGQGHITLAGDAAHAHGGALAAGGSLAIDDAYAFVSALNHIFPDAASVRSKSDISRALALFEATRKPHTDRVIATVHAGNQKALARVRRESPESDDELRARLTNRADPHWIHEHDVNAAFATAVAQLTSDSVSARL